MLFVGLSYVIYYIEVGSFFAHFMQGFFFIINGCWILSKAFSASDEIIIWFLFFILLMWYIALIDLHILKNPCDKPYLIILLMYCWIWLASIFFF